jgi:hypothetical protein
MAEVRTNFEVLSFELGVVWICSAWSGVEMGVVDLCDYFSVLDDLHIQILAFERKYTPCVFAEFLTVFVR